MLVRAPLMQTQQHGAIRVEQLTPGVMTRSGCGLPKERLVPFEADRNVSNADDRPGALHCASAVGSRRLYYPVKRNGCVRSLSQSTCRGRGSRRGSGPTQSDFLENLP